MNSIKISGNEPQNIQRAKMIVMKVNHMIELKKHLLWWDKDESEFKQEYGCSTESLHKGNAINKIKLNEILIKEGVKCR